MSEVTVVDNPTEVVIEIDGGPVLTTTVTSEQQTVIATPSDPVVIDLNSGARGEPGSAVLTGAFYPTGNLGTVGDIFIITGGSEQQYVGAVLTKTLNGWTVTGNIRGPVGGIESVNGQFGPTVVVTKSDVGLASVTDDAQVTLLGPQTITGTKTFTGIVVPDNSFALAAVTGLVSALAAKTGTAGNWTITGIYTFDVAPVVPDASWTIAKTSGLQAALNLKAPLESPIFTGTVAGITKAMVGLANVDNTTDALKPISTAAQAALDLKAPLASPTFTGTVSGITKAMVGLGNVVNAVQVDLTTAQSIAGVKTFTISPIVPTPSTDMQVSTKKYVDDAITLLTTGAPALLNTLDELAAALGDDANFATTVTNNLATKAPLASPTFTGTVSGITKSMVGLANVDNTSDLLKPVSNATQNALNLKQDTIVAGTTSQYRRGDNTWQTLNGVTVDLTTAQSIAGIKTFTSAPVVPDASFGIIKVSGLQSALDTKQPNLANTTEVNNVDWNTFTVNGVHQVNGSVSMGTNAPAGAPIYGTLVVSNTSTMTVQRYYPHQPQSGVVFYVRSKYNASDWQAWRPVADATLAVSRVVHGTNAAVARPSGVNYVEWIGTVSPTNAAANDTWVNTA